MNAINPRAAQHRAPLAEPELPGGGFYKAASLAMLTSAPIWLLIAYGIVLLYRAMVG